MSETFKPGDRVFINGPARKGYGKVVMVDTVDYDDGVPRYVVSEADGNQGIFHPQWLNPVFQVGDEVITCHTNDEFNGLRGKIAAITGTQHEARGQEFRVELDGEGSLLFYSSELRHVAPSGSLVKRVDTEDLDTFKLVVSFKDGTETEVVGDPQELTAAMAVLRQWPNVDMVTLERGRYVWEAVEEVHPDR